jgi:hypothetical protein
MYSYTLKTRYAAWGWDDVASVVSLISTHCKCNLTSISKGAEITFHRSLRSISATDIVSKRQLTGDITYASYDMHYHVAELPLASITSMAKQLVAY